jgi:hypothetical protein
MMPFGWVPPTVTAPPVLVDQDPVSLPTMDLHAAPDWERLARYFHDRLLLAERFIQAQEKEMGRPRRPWARLPPFGSVTKQLPVWEKETAQ